MNPVSFSFLLLCDHDIYLKNAFYIYAKLLKWVQKSDFILKRLILKSIEDNVLEWTLFWFLVN